MIREGTLSGDLKILLFLASPILAYLFAVLWGYAITLIGSIPPDDYRYGLFTCLVTGDDVGRMQLYAIPIAVTAMLASACLLALMVRYPTWMVILLVNGVIPCVTGLFWLMIWYFFADIFGPRPP